MKRQDMAKHIDKEYANLLFNYYARYQDEKGMEDIAEYLEAFKQFVPEAIKATKRPFGFIVKCEDGNLAVTVKTAGRYVKLFYATAK